MSTTDCILQYPVLTVKLMKKKRKQKMAGIITPYIPKKKEVLPMA